MASWWDAGFSSIASQALKSAQKHIDKVLDISEEETAAKKAAASAGRKSPAAKKKPAEDEGDSFWSTWLDSSSTSTPSSSKSTPKARQKQADSRTRPQQKDAGAPGKDAEEMKMDRAGTPGSSSLGVPTLQEPDTVTPTTQRLEEQPGEAITLSQDSGSIFSGSMSESMGEAESPMSEDKRAGKTLLSLKDTAKERASGSETSDKTVSPSAEEDQAVMAARLTEAELMDKKLEGTLQAEVSSASVGARVAAKPPTQQEGGAESSETDSGAVAGDRGPAQVVSPPPTSSLDMVMTASMQTSTAEGWAVDSLILDDQLQDMLASRDSPQLLGASSRVSETACDMGYQTQELVSSTESPEVLEGAIDKVLETCGQGDSGSGKGETDKEGVTQTQSVASSANHDIVEGSDSVILTRETVCEVSVTPTLPKQSTEQDSQSLSPLDDSGGETVSEKLTECKTPDTKISTNSGMAPDAVPVDAGVVMVAEDAAAGDDETRPDRVPALQVDPNVDPVDTTMVTMVTAVQQDSEADPDLVTVPRIEREASTSSLSADDLSDSNRTLIADSSDSDKLSMKDSSQAFEQSFETDSSFQDLTLSGDSMKKSDVLTVSNQSNIPESVPREIQESTISGMSESNSNTNVKNMLEEAMVESSKDNDSHSSVSTERSSDMVRIDSGHTSGDEIDTTTSSDIEIISNPTPNGEQGQSAFRPFDLSPLRSALNRGPRRHSPPGHRRSDSGSSNQSRNGDDAQSPEGGGEDSRHRDGSEASALSAAQVDRLLKPIAEKGESSDLGDTGLTGQSEISDLTQKLAEMAEVLDARERKLVEMSKQQMDLQEANSILRNQLQQSEEAREAEMEDLNTVTAEFTQRLSDMEKKFQTVVREKESLKKQLKAAEEQIIEASDNTATELLLSEKEQQITELMAEGEKLSKQQLQSNNIIKKLRSKEKETESVVKSQKEKMEKQKQEIERLTKVLDTKQDTEKKQADAINQLNAAVQRYDRESQKTRSDLEDAQEKVRSMQVALDNSYKEIAELHKANAARASEAQEAALSAEMQAKQSLQMALDRSQIEAKQRQEAMLNQVEDLRLSLSRMEKEGGRREDILRQEISDLQQRLQEAEGRNEDLSDSVTQATRPLLRQIENLQSTYTAQLASYEKVERNLTERLSEAQSQLAVAEEKARALTEQLLDHSSQQSALESQLSTLRQERSRLAAQYEVERAKVAMMEEAKHSDTVQYETMKHTYEKELSELKKERLLLENQLEVEKMKVESEHKKLTLAHEQLREKEIQLQSARSALPASPVFSREPSVTSEGSHMSQSFVPITQDEVMEKALMISSPNGSKTNLYETLRQTSAASLLEGLQSQLKQREGEITQLQSEIGELEHTREAMAQELVTLTTHRDQLQEKCEELPGLQAKYVDLDQRYNALLQMYGEKVEEAEELRLDLQDVKDMYKSQINELLKNQ